MSSILTFFRRKLLRPVPRKKPAQTPRIVKPSLEILEDRTVMNAVLFIGAGGTLAAPLNWFANANWLDLNTGLNHVPTAADDVGIPGAAGVVAIGGGRLAEVNSIITAAPSTLDITGGSPQPSQLKIDNNPPVSPPPAFPPNPSTSNYFGGSVIDAGLINLNSSSPAGTQAIFAGGAVIGPGDLNGNLDAGPNSSFTFTNTGEFAVGATLGPGSGSVIVAARVQIDGTLQDNTMTLQLVTGGTLTGPTATTGVLEENAILSWLGGTLALGGGTTIGSSGQVLASGGGGKTLAGTLTNMSATSRLDGSGGLTLGAGGVGPGTLVNAAGTLEISLPFITSIIAGSSMTNTALGILNVTSPASAPTTITAPFTNTGNLDVASGDKLVLSNTAPGAAPDTLDGVFQLLGDLQLLGAFTSVNGFMLQAAPGFLEVGSSSGGAAVLTVPAGVTDTLDGNLEVNTGSTLTGPGEIYNAGRLQLDLGSTTMGLGSYVQTSIGTLALAAAGPGMSASLTVTGTASLSGTLVLMGPPPPVGTTYTVVVAGAVSGHFDTIPNGMSETDGPTSVSVTQVRPPV
jgi:hypothetical protein